MWGGLSNGLGRERRKTAGFRLFAEIPAVVVTVMGPAVFLLSPETTYSPSLITKPLLAKPVDEGVPAILAR
jgi:hypothetical protein